MKRLIVTGTLLLGLIAAAAQADTVARHPSGALGFRNLSVPTANNANGLNAPLGFRWWFGEQMVGVDFGVGLSSRKVTTTTPIVADENLFNWAIDVGVPIVLTSWDRVHFLLRPGISYGAVQSLTFGGNPIVASKESDKYLAASAELEAEVFLVQNVSISASQGLGIVNFNPAGPGESTTDFATFGNNFTSLGFHIYLFGK